MKLDKKDELVSDEISSRLGAENKSRTESFLYIPRSRKDHCYETILAQIASK